MPLSSLRIVRSNQTEALVEALYAATETPLPSPFEKELIVVQGRGMGQWLSMELARRAGVFGNAEFLFPKHFVERAFGWVLGERAEADAFTRDHLVWAVAALLPQHLGDAAFDNLRLYLDASASSGLRGAEPSTVPLFQLSARVAEAFDDYLTFRPDLLKKWERGDEHFVEPQLSLFGHPPALDPAIWQRKLWRSLVQLLGEGHAATRERQFVQALKRKRLATGLPTRISVFGISTMPPQYQRILLQLGRVTEVTLYQLSPCQEFFWDLSRSNAKQQPMNGSRDNRLLLAYGTLAAEFNRSLSGLREELEQPETDEELYVERDEELVLGRLQNDILNYRDRASEQTLPEALVDNSVRVHVCHSPTRELEVLHNELAELISVHKVMPHEVIVMMPDVDTYAPLIESVFDRANDDPLRIPYRISDRNLKGESPVLDSLYRTLALAHQRLTVTEVLDLLGLPPVHEHFGIAATELHQLTTWILASGIRWGIDAEHRARFNVAAVEQNTWRFGLRRLLLGYATRCDDFSETADSVPIDLVEGKDGVLLGKLAHFVETLFEFVRQLEVPHSMPAWRSLCTQLLQTLFHADDNNQFQHQQVLDALSALETAATSAHFEQKLDIATFCRLLEQHFDTHRGARGFLSGGVTFCALVPMRSIPFRVVYLIGMDEAAFPRMTRRPDFNLLESVEDRRLCDPNRRNEDRYLFLEAILAARERLILSYVGQSIRDNQGRATSVVVTELLDYLTEQYQLPKDLRRNPVCVFHPLQPFNPRYFNRSSPMLFSYEGSYLAGAQQVASPRNAPAAFFSRALPLAELPQELPLRDLLSFFTAPCSFLLRRRLGLYLEEDTLEIPEREPLALDPLERYKLGDFTLKRRKRDVSEAQCLHLAHLSGDIPVGSPGRYEFLVTLETVRPLLEKLDDLCAGEIPRARDIRVNVGPYTLFGRIPGILADKSIQYQFSKLNGKSRIRSWLHHLLLCAAAQTEPTLPTATYLLARRSTDEGLALLEFRPVADAKAMLHDLIHMFHQGQSFPLPLFPETSLNVQRQRAYRASWETEFTQSAALRRVYGALEEPAAVPLPSGDEVPLELNLFEFNALAQRFYGPLLDHVVAAE